VFIRKPDENGDVRRWYGVRYGIKVAAGEKTRDRKRKLGLVGVLRYSTALDYATSEIERALDSRDAGHPVLDEHHRSPRLVLAQVSPVAMTLRSTRRSGNPFTYRNLMHWTTNSSSDIEISSCALVAALMLTAAALALVGLAAVR